MAATWRFGAKALAVGQAVLARGGTALDAVEAAVRFIESDTAEQYFVGVGGLPNSDGVMELDAGIMDGATCSLGAVLAIRDIANPVSVARAVMESSPHNVIVGEGATEFAEQHGFVREDILTPDAHQRWQQWLQLHDRKPAASVAQSLGPHSSDRGDFAAQADEELSKEQHDTVGVVALDAQGNLAVAVSTSGWAFAVPGRVGDSPLVGCGYYADNAAGAAVATGDGEQIMRCCLCFLVVEAMRHGRSPAAACQYGIERLRLIMKGQHTCAGVIAVTPTGEVGAGTTITPASPHRSAGFFPYAVWRPEWARPGAAVDIDPRGPRQAFGDAGVRMQQVSGVTD